MSPRLLGYIRLTRPANLVTALADVLAGFAISGYITCALQDRMSCLGLGIDGPNWIAISSLLIATMCLYGGGVVLNDVYDAKLDSEERPERPIPSGVVELKHARMFGFVLLIIGFALSVSVHVYSGALAFAICVFVISYNIYSKHKTWLGPINMGLCRGLNLLLGMSVIGYRSTLWWLLFLPIIYIAAITMVSQGEVHANNKKKILQAGILYGVVLAILSTLFLVSDFSIVYAAPFILFFAWNIYKPLVKAYKKNEPGNIKRAVKAGVMSLIVLNASFSAGFVSWWYGVMVLLLLPVSIFFAKRFAVT